MATGIKPVNVVIVTDSYWPTVGGSENVIRALTNHLPKHIHTKIVTHHLPQNTQTLYHSFAGYGAKSKNDPQGHSICYLNASSARKALLLPLLLWNLIGFRHFRTPKIYDSLYFWYRITFYRALATKIVDADIVHSFSTSYCARLVTEICTARKIPLIHAPCIHFGRWGDSPETLRSYMNGNVVICPTEHFKKLLLLKIQNIKSLPIEVIPPVFSLCASADTTHSQIDGPFMLFLGRREAHKGLNLLLKAFENCNIRIKLVIAGPGEKPSVLHSNVIDLGVVSEQIKADLLYHCEFLVVPTSDESFGIVFTEAMSFGKPVIALDIHPVNEIILNGLTGILVPPEDDDALSKAICTIGTNPQCKKSMGLAGKKRYDTYYNLSITIDKLTNIYSALIDSKKS